MPICDSEDPLAHGSDGRVRGSAQAPGRGAKDWLAQPVPAAGKGVSVSHAQGAGMSAPYLHPRRAQKTLPDIGMISDKNL